MGFELVIKVDGWYLIMRNKDEFNEFSYPAPLGLCSHCNGGLERFLY